MLFISHSTKDEAEARKLHALLLQRGYDSKQLFLDSDEKAGIGAGEKWKQVLYDRLKDCHVLVVLCSPNWEASQWCFAEFVYADMHGKEIFPVIIADGDIGGIASEHQSVFVTKDGDKAYERLFAQLEAKQFGPKDHLPWPHPDLKDVHGQPDACPFPGLLAFDERYAAVYFGREPEIQTVLEQLNEMRRKGEPRLLMIVGGSGSGKSSLLKAGLLPRLKHRLSDTDWLVLPTLRYGDLAESDNAFFQVLAEHIVDHYPATATNKPNPKNLCEQFANSNAAQAAVAFWETAHELSRARECPEAAVLLPVDQFEELLSPSSGVMAANFLRFLKAICQRPNRRLLVIGTMRSDYLDVYEQHESALQAPLFHPWRLEPFPRERLGAVIEKPAARVNVEVASDLVERLKTETPTADALPLLAFTLEKLFRRCAGDKRIELSKYEQLGGMTGAITQAVDRILPRELPKETEQALRLCFVKHLAQVNEKDEIVRCSARWSQLPDTAKPLLEQFIRERLLSKSGNDSGEQFIEVSHEALFRCWGQLTRWLQESSRVMRWRRDNERVRIADGPRWSGLTRTQLAVARTWPAEHPDELSVDEITWIKRGIRQEQIRRSIVIAIILFVSGLGALAFYERTVAIDAIRKTLIAEKKVTDQAIQSEQEARQSEREKSKLLAKSYFDAAQLAAQRGRWSTALSNLNKIPDEDNPDPVGLLLAKVKALCALDDLRQARQELDKLAQRKDLRNHEGSVILWQADIELVQTRIDEEPKALHLVEKALQKGLPDSEKAYAKALLATTAPDAIQHLQRAIKLGQISLDPNVQLASRVDLLHPRANAMLVGLLISLGRLSEARLEIAAAETLYSEDPTFKLLRAIVDAIEDDMPAATAALDEAKSQMTTERFSAVADRLKLENQFHRAINDFVQSPDDSIAVLKLAPLIANAMAQASRADILTFPGHPIYHKAFARVRPLVTQPWLLFSNKQLAVDEWGWLVSVYPEGLFYFLYGGALGSAERWTEAEAAFLEAAKVPSSFRVQHPALLYLVLAELVLANKSAPEPADKTRFTQNLRKLVMTGDVPPKQRSALTIHALALEEWGLARWILLDWQRDAPNDIEAMKWQAILEFNSKAYGPTVEWADKLLKQKPGDAKALEIREKAIQRHRKQLEMWDSASPTPESR